MDSCFRAQIWSWQSARQKRESRAERVSACTGCKIERLITADESLPGTPIEAIAMHRQTEVNRRAQALAF